MRRYTRIRIYLYLASLIIFVLLCTVILSSVERVVRRETIRQYSSYQELQAIQAARGIENFFHYYILSLKSLAAYDSVAVLDVMGKELLSTYYNGNSTDIQAVTRVDQFGRIIYTVPEVPGMIGTDITYQPHIQRILADHRVVVSDIFMSAQGYETVALHVPVYQEGEFLGTLAVLLPFESLATNNLYDISAAGNQVWMLSSIGTELYSPSPSHTGQTIYDTHHDSPEFIDLIDQALASESGTGSFQAFEVEFGMDLEPSETMHAAYSRVHIPNDAWTVVISTQEDIILTTMEDFRNRWLVISLVFFFGSIVLAGYIVRENRKSAEEQMRLKDSIEIRELKEFNDRVFSAMAEGLMVIDQDGKITTINPSGAYILGISSKDAVGRNLDEIIKDDESGYRRTIDEIHQQGKPSRLEITYQNPTGSRQTLTLAISPLYQDGDLKGTTIVFSDNTASKLAAQALQDSQMRYRNIFEGVRDAIFVARLDGEIIDANQQASELYGRDRSLLIGSNINDLSLPGELRLTGSIENGQTASIHMRQDGTLFPVEISRSIQKFIEEELLLVVVRDVTSRVEHEKELEAILSVAAALRTPVTLNEMLQALLYQVTHIFKFEGAAVALRDENSEKLSIPLGTGAWEAISTDRMAEQYTRSSSQDGSVSDEVLHNGMPYVCNDPDRHPEFLKRFRSKRTLAIACLPLITQQRTIGVLWVGSQIAIGEKEIRLMTAIANIAANGIYRARLHEETQRRVQRLAALRNIDITITASLDLRLTLDILLGQVISHLNVDAACVLLFNPNLQALEYSTGNGFRTNSVNRSRLRLGEDLAGMAALERKVINLPNLNPDEKNSPRMKLLEGENFVSYIAVPLLAKGGVKGVLEIFHRSNLTPDAEWLDFLEAIAAQAAIAIDNARMFDELQRSNMELVLAYDATLEGWVHALDMRDKETEGHTQRVTSATIMLARTMGIPEPEMIHIRRGALLHDIGKVAIPDRILRKTGPLNPDEREEIKLHPTYAYELLSPISYLRPALDIPYCHHEKWDGTGYPRGLRGEQIPMVARVFAVIDVWDALRSNRPYREAWPDDKVIEYLCAESGKHFDPRVIDVFMNLVSKLNNQ